MRTHTDISGMRFGRLIAVSFLRSDKWRASVWSFKCDCGKETEASISSVRSGNTQSCGCYGKEQSAVATRKLLLVHGMSKSPTANSWNSMIARCYNVTNHNFKKYGALGIKVCEFLRSTPVNVVLLIGERPKGTSIDRINNTFGYWCGTCAECLASNWTLNVRWATRTQQTRNRRITLAKVVDGELKCCAEIAESKGISYDKAHYRYFRKQPVSLI